MSKITIPYSQTGYFSKLICDYIAENQPLHAFYNRFPNSENFAAQLEEKNGHFGKREREILVASLTSQYSDVNTSEATMQNINALARENTFTITTGHQLNLFTGPLYFLYKIISVINLTETLNKKHPNNHFVPIYWMATEDHDFDEINYFNFGDQKIQWNRESGGAVGELSTEGLNEVLDVIKTTFGAGVNATRLEELFSEAYVKHDNLANATRYLGNELFKEYGLVIVDGNDSNLKSLFAPYVKKELLEEHSFLEITKTTKRLTDLGYPEQVHSREINLFYIVEGIRERIVKVDGRYFINDTEMSFSKAEILTELENHPERFSPNALLRPLFQEVILPNLCYVGGGGELAYWFQLKDYFKSVDVPFPMLLLRNSALISSKQNSEKLERLAVGIDELFQKQDQLKTAFTKKISEIDIDFSSQKEHLQSQFKALYDLAKKTDASFLGAVGAQEKKQLNGLDHLEKRLLKAQKRKLADQLERLTLIQDGLFPKKSLQERNRNFSEFYLEYGDELIPKLKAELDPLHLQFTVINL